MRAVCGCGRAEWKELGYGGIMSNEVGSIGVNWVPRPFFGRMAAWSRNLTLMNLDSFRSQNCSCQNLAAETFT
jgi:hypothetical protein